jgi:hypothetical protein
MSEMLTRRDWRATTHRRAGSVAATRAAGSFLADVVSAGWENPFWVILETVGVRIV